MFDKFVFFLFQYNNNVNDYFWSNIPSYISTNIDSSQVYSQHSPIDGE